MTTWLHRIVVNSCLDRLRKQQRRQAEQPLPADPDRTAELVAEAAPDPVEQQELRDDLSAALAQLNADQRAALVLVDVEGYSVDEAAAILGVPAGTVKSRCARGRGPAGPAAAEPTGGELMAQPLPLSYNWRAPLVFATVGLVTCIGILVRGQAVGWVSAAVALVLCWAAYCVVVWLRTRSYLLVEGPVLTTRRWRDFERVEASQVRAVKELATPAGRSYRLEVDRGGEPGRVTVPTALLLRGPSTLFTWILAQAPDAALDKRSRRTLELLQTRGLVE